MTNLLSFLLSLAWFAIVTAATMSLTGCHTALVYENQKSEARLSQNVSDAGSQVLTMKTELERHQNILATLNKRVPPPSKEIISQAKSKFTTADKAYAELQIKFKAFRTASGEFGAYAHTRPNVYSVDADWKTADDWQQTLQKLGAEFNRQLRASADSLNDLNLFWQNHGLYRKHSVVAMANELQADTENWRATYSKLVSEFNLGQTNFNTWQASRTNQWTTKIDNALYPLQAMHKNLDEMSQLIQKIDRLKDEYESEFAGSSEVTTLDSRWPTWQKFESARNLLRSQFKNVADHCNQYYAKFNQGLQDSSRQPATSVGAEDQKQSPR